ncbi:uncharacterized protein LOC128740570 [Sabethes cyaneus]|uniref:uncharacterized protein LOC128740570 n=1 Tax=Sabethes cyaneus TaxID=53552 RepID=UPI00237DA180|nr:uncharacterized protein LOC128740570 [Sabethes cyaneus]
MASFSELPALLCPACGRGKSEKQNWNDEDAKANNAEDDDDDGDDDDDDDDGAADDRLVPLFGWQTGSAGSRAEQDANRAGAKDPSESVAIVIKRRGPKSINAGDCNRPQFSGVLRDLDLRNTDL